MPIQSSAERVSQVRRSLEEAEVEIKDWFKRYKLIDQQRQYETQLETLNRQVTFLLCKVKTELEGVDLREGCTVNYRVGRFVRVPGRIS